MEFLHRSFADAQLEVGTGTKKGRVTGLVVPYNRPTDIAEIRDGELVRYSEQFAPGSMGRAIKAPNRVSLQFTHSDAFADALGYGVSFADSAEGCVGEFQLYPAVRDKALDVLESSHRGLSVTFASLRPLGGFERDGELVTRSEVACRAVAAVTDPAYADAAVLALRQADELARAAAEAQAEADRARAAMAESLQWLVDHGQPLTEVHREWLAAHQVTLREPVR